MDVACCKGRRKARQPSPKFWAFPGVPVPKFGSVHEWLEDLREPSSWQPLPSFASYSNNSSSSVSSNGEQAGSLWSWSSGVPRVQENKPKEKSSSTCRGPSTRVRPSGANTHREARLSGGRSSAPDGSAQAKQKQQHLDEKGQAKRSFSKFLDEVTSNVFGPDTLQALGRPASPSTTTEDEGLGKVTWERPMILCSMAQKQGSAPQWETITSGIEKQPLGTYLETDIDAIGGENRQCNQKRKEGTPPPFQEVVDGELVIPPPPQFCQGFEMRTLFHCRLPRHPYRSVSLPRGINMVSRRCGQWREGEPSLGTFVSDCSRAPFHIEKQGETE